MAQEEMAVRLVETEARSKSNTHRIDTLEENADALNKLAAAMGFLLCRIVVPRLYRPRRLQSDGGGGAKGGVKHLDILKVYNNFRPLARGYKVQAKDGYCAATVSAAYMGRKGSKAARAIELLDIIIKVYYCKYGKGYSALLKSG